MRTAASYTAVSPCGWYLPITSPTMRALFLNGASLRLPSSRIAYRMRRCTGFWPSSTAGKARPFTTLIAYAR
jgi:hypothetical protein